MTETLLTVKSKAIRMFYTMCCRRTTVVRRDVMSRQLVMCMTLQNWSVVDVLMSLWLR